MIKAVRAVFPVRESRIANQSDFLADTKRNGGILAASWKVEVFDYKVVHLKSVMF